MNIVIENDYNSCYDTVVNNLDAFRQNSAIVFDLDDTLVRSSNGSIIKQMKKLYLECVSRNITIFIITARDPCYRISTEKMLKRVGLGGYRQLIMCEWDGNDNIGQLKAHKRKTIYDDGYTIFYNIGDSSTDFSELDGKYYFENGIKLI